MCWLHHFVFCRTVVVHIRKGLSLALIIAELTFGHDLQISQSPCFANLKLNLFTVYLARVAQNLKNLTSTTTTLFLLLYDFVVQVMVVVVVVPLVAVGVTN